MTLTIVIYDFSLIGGAETVALNLANALSQSYDVNVISIFSKNPDPIVTLNSNVKVHVLDTEVRSITLNIFKYSKKLRAILSESTENVVISITAGMNGIVKLATRGMKSKIIYAEHSNLKNDQYGFKHRLRQKIGAKYFDYIVTLSESDRKEFIKRFNINEDKVKTIYNWVEKPDHEKPIKYDYDSKVIVSVGRVVKVKGYDRAVRIATQFFEEFPDWTWEIYGDGDEFNSIQNLINQNNISSQMILKGFTSDIEHALSGKSLFASTSTYEGFPISFLEAREFKLPIVSFDCPTGPKEIINDKKDGVLVEAYNEEKYLESLKNLAKNKENRIFLSNNLKLSENKFTKEKILNDWIELIEYE